MPKKCPLLNFEVCILQALQRVVAHCNWGANETKIRSILQPRLDNAPGFCCFKGRLLFHQVSKYLTPGSDFYSKDYKSAGVPKFWQKLEGGMDKDDR